MPSRPIESRVWIDTPQYRVSNTFENHICNGKYYDHEYVVIKQVLKLQVEEGLLSTLNLGMLDEEEEEEGIYVKSSHEQILKLSFTKSFISIMKLMKPVLSVEATDILAEEYATMREVDSERGNDRANALTARAMDSMVRLATAHAKARASRSVDAVDAEAAIRLMQHAYFGTVRRQGGERDVGEQGVEQEDGGSAEDEVDSEAVTGQDREQSDQEEKHALFVSSLAR